MYNFLTSLAAVAVVLGIMVIVHEFGHFAAAKLFRVRVEQFAIGFGKRLFGFRHGGTDYRVNLLPFGGYVKMAGENPLENRTGDPGEFTSHPRWQRFIIAVAGPAANVFLAIGLLVVVYMVRYERPTFFTRAAEIGWVEPNSPAAKAGIEAGDRIVRIEGIADPTWEDVLPKVVLSPGQPVSLTVSRSGQNLDKTITPVSSGPDEFGVTGWQPKESVTVSTVEPDSPAAKAGVRPGDQLISVNGHPVYAIEGFINLVQENGGNPGQFVVQRHGQTLQLTVTPQKKKDERGQERYLVGVLTRPDIEVVKLPFAQAMAASLDDNKKSSVLILQLVQKMMQRKVGLKQVSGPIGIARASGEAAREKGWTPLMQLMSAISLNLAIFNLFPFPILDGGLILMLAIEAIRRRDISLRVKERVYQLAFVLLVLFAVVIIFNDLSKIPGLQRLP